MPPDLLMLSSPAAARETVLGLSKAICCSSEPNEALGSFFREVNEKLQALPTQYTRKI